MKRHLILLFVGVSLPFLLAAQQKNSVSITKRVLRIPEVTVVGKRPMKDIGVQRTRFDSIAMKENIALSMADVLTFNSSVFVKNYGRAFFFQAEDGIRSWSVTGVQTCALPICRLRR